VNRSKHRASDAGFTLVEILLVVVILGTLASVVAFALTNMSGRGRSAALSSDENILATAQAAHFAQYGRYASEDLLVSSGLLRSESINHDFVVSPDGMTYTLVLQVAAPSTTTA
jgi:prepilin-type N-terminal cleavage/methylation domain-containing protein